MRRDERRDLGANIRLTPVTPIQRLNTKGGIAAGPCDSAGASLSVPYSADYAFSRRVADLFRLNRADDAPGVPEGIAELARPAIEFIVQIAHHLRPF